MELRLEREQVQVIQTGQWILISIPSLFVFAEHTANISLSSYGMLNDVICFIKMFRKVEIDINVYESCCDKHQRMLALTRLRASRIADYFVSQGIDSRIVLTRGMANDKPIMKTDRSEYHLANSRIEILFKEEII
jgi:intracellular multiplication protein IcmN